MAGQTYRRTRAGRQSRWLRSAAQARSGLGSFGSPRTRSPTMLRWICEVPPQIVSDRLKKKVDSIGLTL